MEEIDILLTKEYESELYRLYTYVKLYIKEHPPQFYYYFIGVGLSGMTEKWGSWTISRLDKINNAVVKDFIIKLHEERITGKDNSELHNIDFTPEDNHEFLMLSEEFFNTYTEYQLVLIKKVIRECNQDKDLGWLLNNKSPLPDSVKGFIIKYIDNWCMSPVSDYVYHG